MTSITDDGAEIGEHFEQPGSNKFFHVKPLADVFPEDAKVYFSKFNPGIKLYDFIGNTNSWLVVSNKIKQMFDDFGVKDVEFLRVAVIDHNGDYVSEDYYILNILNEQNIVDVEKSTLRVSPFDGQIQRFRNFVTDPVKVDPEVHLFRPVNASGFYIISNELKILMETENCSGCTYIEADGWNGNKLSLMNVEWDPS